MTYAADLATAQRRATTSKREESRLYYAGFAQCLLEPDPGPEPPIFATPEYARGWQTAYHRHRNRIPGLDDPTKPALQIPLL